MKWQKARIVSCAAVPAFVGATVWVQAQPPIEVDGSETDVVYGLNYDHPVVFISQLLTPKENKQILIQRHQVELQSEFADDVPMIPWEHFAAECRARA